ncbi:MAG: type II secretion system F family protein [Actinomycetaceae bacterium]|nr:type II secretion system F family protein [Actinomycetaceae bacterium]
MIGESFLTAGAAVATGFAAACVLSIRTVLRQRERRVGGMWFGTETLPPSAGTVDVAFTIGEVAARLRAGATVEAAWTQALQSRGLPAGDIDEDGIPQTVVTHPDFKATSSALRAGGRMTRETGIPLANILETVLQSLEDANAAHDARKVARAGPELTAKMLTFLPLLGIACAAAFGASVREVFFTVPIGRVVGLVGIFLWGSGYLWIRRIVATETRDDADPVDPLVVVDLVKAALDAGASIPRALDAVSMATGDERFEAVARALVLGATSSELRHYAGALYGCVVDAVFPAWTCGVSPTPLLELAAQTIRRERMTAAKEGSERLAIRLTVPVGLCLLPAFVCVGIFPVGILFFGY